MSHPVTQRAAIGQRMDALPFNRLHMLLFTVLGLGLLFDQMEGSMTSVLTAVFSEPGSGVSRQALSSMLTFYYIVAALGAPIMGAVADRFGRRIALVVTLTGFGALTLVSVMMPDFTGFAIFRVASSFALSAVPPLVFSYIADTLPPAVRGVMMMLISIMSGLGAALAPILTHWGNDARPLGLQGWEAAMVIGGVAGIVLGIVTLLLPESPRWLSARNRPAQAEQAMARFEASRRLTRAPHPAGAEAIPATPMEESRVAAPREFQATIGTCRGRLLLVIVMLFLQSCGLSGFALLLTKALIVKGMAMQEALAYSSLILLAMPVGVIASAFVTDRFARRAMFVGMSVILGLSAIAFGMARGEMLLLATGFLFSFLMTAHSSIGQIYCAEMFPTAIRGTAMGLGYAAVRTGSAFVPVVLLPLLLDHGPTLAFAAIGGALLASGLIARLFGPLVMPRAQLA